MFLRKSLKNLPITRVNIITLNSFSKFLMRPRTKIFSNKNFVTKEDDKDCQVNACHVIHFKLWRKYLIFKKKKKTCIYHKQFKIFHVSKNSWIHIQTSRIRQVQLYRSNCICSLQTCKFSDLILLATLTNISHHKVWEESLGKCYSQCYQ